MDSIKRLDLRNNGCRKLMLLGKTGTGKSALCNALCQKLKVDDTPYKRIFPESADMEAGNTDTILTEIKYLGKRNRSVSLIDTVGFDSTIKRTSEIADLIYALKERCDYINIFAIVLADPKRIEDSLKDTIGIFVDLFGKERFWNNAVLIFTNIDRSDAAMARRESRAQADDQMINNFKRALKFMFKIDQNMPAIILDAHYSGSAEDEKRRFSEAAESLYGWLNSESFTNCSMDDIDAVIELYGENYEGLREELRKINQKYDKLKEEQAKLKEEQAKLKEEEAKRNSTTNKILLAAAIGVAGTAGTIGAVVTKNPNAAATCATATAGIITKLVYDIDVNDLK